MIGPRNVHADELGDADGKELHEALRVANVLGDAMEDLPVPAGEQFADKVMAALAYEPTPGTTGFLVPLRRRGILAGLGASVRQAWTSMGTGRPMLGRSAALAYVLAVALAAASLTGAAALGAAGAFGLLGATPTESPEPLTPSPTAPPPTAPPSPSNQVTQPTEAPTPTPTATDDEDDDNSGPGGGNGSRGGDDNSGPSGDSGGEDDGDSSGPSGNSGPG
jgi:negative regulator of sigma E activity